MKALLQGAIDSDLKCNDRTFINLATQTFHDRVLSRSRTYYIGGVLLGVVMLVAGARVTPLLSDSAITVLGMETRACCAWILLFAGMGTVCSVFSRLGSIDMCNETSPWFLGLSGFFRPVTASLFALAIVQILKLEIVTIRLPTPEPGKLATNSLEHFYLLTAFLAGFSERFTSDLIGRAERVIVSPDRSALGSRSSREDPKTSEPSQAATIEPRIESTVGPSAVTRTPAA